MKRVAVLGVPVDLVTQSEAVQWVADAVKDSRPRQVVTVNPELVMHSRRNPALAAVLSGADLCVPDGTGVVWAARRRGLTLPARVTGVDLIPALAARGASAGWRFFLLGGRPGVAEATAAVLGRQHPRLIVAGTLAPSAELVNDVATAAAVRAAATDVLLVAYGAPAQELWIARNLERTGAAVAIGVGGAFDFLSGRAPRAPTWMRRHSLEWLHRLIRQPWRWRRMVALPQFVGLVLRENDLNIPSIGRASKPIQ